MKIFIRKSLILMSIIFLGKLCDAQEKQFINPDSLPPLSKNYTQAVKVKGGSTIFIAGQASVNAKKELIGKGDFEAQVTRTLENLRTVLSASKATPADLVKINIYVVDLNSDKLMILRDHLKDFVGPNPPVSTLLGVQALFNKDALIEIEGIAVVH
ncbi:RidA family protein [Mucilaginibacter frigoritolerans]|nr:RidA family protein [Mucilaginibacter frigoritolerans]